MRIAVWLCALAVAGAPLPVAAAQFAGIAVNVDPNAIADLDNVPRPLDDGADLFMGERVVTTDSGLVQIEFSDSTLMVVGPNSSLLIEEYLLRNDQTVSRFSINALSGTFRFITGDSDHNAYEIKTPTGTISVRGTAFDLDVDPVTQEALTLLYNGGLDICANGRCRFQRATCSIGVISTSADIRSAAQERLRIFAESFPWSISQRHLGRKWRISNARDCEPAEEVEEVAELPPPPPPPPPPPEEEPKPHHGHHHHWHGHGHGHDWHDDWGDGQNRHRNRHRNRDDD